MTIAALVGSASIAPTPTPITPGRENRSGSWASFTRRARSTSPSEGLAHEGTAAEAPTEADLGRLAAWFPVQVLQLNVLQLAVPTQLKVWPPAWKAFTTSPAGLPIVVVLLPA